ncbi:phospholipase ABHD3 isoform X1 [Ornithorhynchus anatinus]|uniref:Abhydrolase domain containing 3, phospholipase n=1 Tax=Ornithorhynchus anatinus TaxID=9258 RepID=A0A6I8NIM0_ORNAN|nr:phospholipase ABHD3 isoform X1 [Ornithorhynchus anatinus]
MQLLAMDLQMLSRELSLYLDHQVRVGFLGSGVGLSLVLGFGVAYACYYLSSIAKKPQLVTGGESFSRFLQDHCPVVTETYYPTVWCWESRGQTLLRPFITAKPRVLYRNELIKTSDGGQISLDWFDNESSVSFSDASTRPTVLLLPGLTGTSKESYILHMIQLSEELGYRCVVFNNRGVAGESLLTPRTYCCANTEDLETVIHHVHSLHPSAPFLAAGVSMGGMLLLNYLGKTGSKTPLLAAATFSVGWNTFACAESLEKPLNWLLFNYYLTTCLQSSVNKHRHMFVKQIDMDHVMKRSRSKRRSKIQTSLWSSLPTGATLAFWRGSGRGSRPTWTECSSSSCGPWWSTGTSSHACSSPGSRPDRRGSPGSGPERTARPNWSRWALKRWAGAGADEEGRGVRRAARNLLLGPTLCSRR